MLRSLAVALLSFVSLAPFAIAQQNMQPTDAAALKPPPGARVAIVEFADMECPKCAQENPILKDAAAKYHVAWMRHDFPLPQHQWSFQAAVNARWLDTKSKMLGDDYRDYIFASQRSIESPDDLRNYTEGFAKSKGVALPFAIDPQNKLSGEVKADGDLGTRLGVHATPTIWVVSNAAGSQPVAVTDLSNPGPLYAAIESALAQSAPTQKVATARKR